jgi:beta-glucosidase
MVSETPLYRDAAAPVSERVRDLLARMTLEEKAAQTATFRLGGVGGGGLLQAIPRDEVRPFMMRMGAGLGMPEGGLPEPPPGARLGVFREDGTLDEAKAEALLATNPGGGTSGAGATPRAQAETANAVQRIAREKTRLGIPVIFHGEGLHGYVSSGTTIFPQALALAGTWNPELVGSIGRAIGTEARAMGAHDLFAPVLDIARDPRWGRTEETYGEDPHLASRMGVAIIRGMQGQRLSDPDAVACGGKHFGGHGGPLGGRDSNMEGITERDLREVHFRTFRAAIEEAGAQSIMAAYHAIDSVPCHANHWLLTEVLREEWGFRGHVVSDAGGVEGIHEKHHVARDHREAVRMAIEAGVDTFLAFGSFTPAIIDLAEKGELSVERLNETVGWILRLKFELGLFDQPYTDPDLAEAVCNSPAHRALALEAARQSIVLLKNDGDLLPLAGSARKILVAGPNADAARN